MESLSYEIVDVFTDRPFTGNPLAVVYGADGLPDRSMRALAREFHLSETVFVLPPTTPEATYRLRIFTVERELPFAGHPSVGAAVAQMRRGLVPPGDVVQECGAGLLPVWIGADGTARLRGGVPEVGEPVDPEPLLAALGLEAADFAGPAPRTAGCGLAFPYLAVRPEALPRIRSDAAVARRYGIDDVSVFAWDGARRIARTRVFFGSKLDEDPATGSAALGFGVWLVASGLLPGEGESAYAIEQGTEIGRPSTLSCVVTARGGRAVSVTVSGSVVSVARGDIAVPPM